MRFAAYFNKIVLAGTLASYGLVPGAVFAEPVAKQVFGRMTSPANLQSASYGFYTKGCLAGAVAIPVDGPTWQVMRLSRNRRWGHPELINTIEQLSIKASKVGWNGILVGDISQPRGGPMLTGHASHQIGLDADLWLTPMPDRRLTYKEREETSAINILKEGTPYVNNRRWNKSYENLLRTAASFSQVERVLVHPGIKKKLCDTVQGDRSWLSKLRPVYGHNYHFHIRLRCQSGSPACKSQEAPPSDDGCGAALKWWFDVALAPRKPSPKPAKPEKPKPKREITVSQLPSQCGTVLSAGDKPASQAEYQSASLSGFVAPELNGPKTIDPLAALNSKPIEAGKGAKFAKVNPLLAPAPANAPAKSGPAPAASVIVDPVGDLVETATSAANGFAPFAGNIPVPTPRPLN